MIIFLLEACETKEDGKKEEAKPLQQRKKRMKLPKRRGKKSPEKIDDGSLLNPYIEEETGGRKVDFGEQDEGGVCTHI